MLIRRPVSSSGRGRIHVPHVPPWSNDVAFFGDSIMQGAGSTNENGLRVAIYNRCTAQGYPYRFVGPRNHGNFGAVADRNHNGLPAAQTGARLTDWLASYGPGRAYPSGKLIYVMLGTNDMRQPGGQYNLTTSMANYTALLTAMRRSWPRARIVVMNCTHFDPVLEAEAAGRVAAYNTALAGVCASFTTGLPIIQFDTAGVLGAFNAANYNADGIHWNDTGYGIVNPALVAVAAADAQLARAA